MSELNQNTTKAQEMAERGALRIASKIDLDATDRRNSVLLREAVESVELHWRDVLVRNLRGMNATIREQAETIAAQSKQNAELLAALHAIPCADPTCLGARRMLSDDRISAADAAGHICQRCAAIARAEVR
jgi:hypothetical protein